MDNREELHGSFKRYRYEGPGFAIAVFESDGENIVAVGPLNGLKPKDRVCLYGEYINHPRYGLEFKADSFLVILPEEDDEVASFLSSDLFKGIGIVTAAKIIQTYGTECLEQWKKDPDLIYDTDLSTRQKDALYNGFITLSDPIEKERILLIKAGFFQRDINMLANTYGPEMETILNENPYRFFYEIHGIGFDKCDRFALLNGMEEDDLRRRTAILIHIFESKSFESGNTRLREEDFADTFYKKTGFDSFEETLNEALGMDLLIEENAYYYRSREYRDEVFIAERLSEFAHPEKEEDELNEKLISLQNEWGIIYESEQLKAIQTFFDHSFSVITGGPGTGKTTIIKAMVELMHRINPLVYVNVVAPTGRAAKRIGELCNVESRTIHSLLGWDKETNKFNYNADNPLLVDVLIIDEFSMVDNRLFASILKASGAIKKICIIGDNHQLPSIAPGNVLSDLLKANIYPHTVLSANFRQKKDNEIISLAQAINDENFDEKDYGKDVHFMDDVDLKSLLLKEVQKEVDNGADLSDIQVLSPMHKGGTGIEALNDVLRDTYNPQSVQKKEMRFGKILFREGDKVLQLKNQSSDDVYNGDIGFLECIQKDKKNLLCRFDNISVVYPFEDISVLTLAYAISVHKAQGNEYPIVFMVISAQNWSMLEKKLIYTAVTRAKRKLFIIGDIEVFKKALRRQRPERDTGLMEKLEYYRNYSFYPLQ